MFVAIALFQIVSAAAAAEAPFYRWPPLLLGIIVVCVLAATYLERWVFDTRSRAMERNLGPLLGHTRNRTPFSELARVMLREAGPADEQRSRVMQAVSRRAAIVAIEDRVGKSHPLDPVKGAKIQEARKLAERVATFLRHSVRGHCGRFAGGIIRGAIHQGHRGSGHGLRGSNGAAARGGQSSGSRALRRR